MSAAAQGPPTRASIRRRVLLGTLTITALAIAGAGFAADRIVRARLVANHTSSLVAVLEGGAVRACAETRHIGKFWPDGTERAWPLADGDTSGNLWFVRRPGADDPIAVSAGFPADGAPVTDAALERSTPAMLREIEGEDGEPFRVASFTITPADMLPAPPDGPEQGRFRDGGVGDPDGGPRGFGERGPGGPGGRQRGEGDRSQRFGDRRRPPRRPREAFAPDERYEVFVAASIADEVATLADLRRTLFGSGLGAILISALLITFVVRRGVAPLRELSSRVSELDETNLGEHIEVPEAPAELVPIVTALESTRARLSSAFERERRFTADAAHELRTPLAGLRATLEVALRRERSVETHREYASQCLAVARSMEDTLEGLLILARAEEISDRVETVDVADELDRAFGTVRPELQTRQLTVTSVTTPGTSPVVSSVAPLVERIASNLARNAAAHAIPGSEVTYSIGPDGPDRVAMTVTNTCAPLPPEASERAFEAFWRADTARTGEGEHVGLGLPLVAKAAEALGGSASIQVTDVDDERARFSIRVSLPRSSAA